MKSLIDCRKKMPKASFYRGLAELEEKALIKTKGEEIVWIAGDFAPMEKKYQSQKQDSNSLKNETPPSLKNGTGSLKNETKKSQKRDSPPHTPQKDLNIYINTTSRETEKDAREAFAAEVADEVFGEPDNTISDDFSQIVIEGLRERLKIFNEYEFLVQIEKIEAAGIFTAERALDVFDLLEKIRKKKRGSWRIKADYWAESVPHYEMLKEELERLENEEKSGVNNGTNKRNPSGNGNQTRTKPLKTNSRTADERWKKRDGI